MTGEGSAQGRIPFRLRIGVAGHRQLNDPAGIARAVGLVLARVRALVPETAHTAVLLAAVSPIAEGADRLVAHEILKEERSVLEVTLPLLRDDYLRDFDTDESRKEFGALLARARHVSVMPPAPTRADAYAAVGRYVVDHCDALIAIWDGERARGHGGTAEIVDYARSRNVPVFRIDSISSHAISEELGRGFDLRAFDELDEYNHPSFDANHFDGEMITQMGIVSPTGIARGIEPLLKDHLDWMMPYFVRADLLAQQNQGWHYYLNSVILLLAAFAVAVIAGQIIFASHIAWFAWLEISVLIILLLTVFVGRWRGFSERWIWCRFLAERFRSALFVAFAGLPGDDQGRPGRVYLGRRQGEWVRRAYEEAWSARPESRVTETDVSALRQYLVDAWIESQRRWHEGNSRRDRLRHARLAFASAVLFVATFTAAVVHASGAFDEALVAGARVPDLAVFLSLSLPGLAAALTGISEYREFERNAQRYDQMAGYLAEIKARVEAADGLASVRRAVEEANAVMLQENSDWLVIMGFHDPSLR